MVQFIEAVRQHPYFLIVVVTIIEPTASDIVLLAKVDKGGGSY